MQIFGIPPRLGLAVAMTAALPGAGAAETNILFILDGSNSMWGQIQGEAKIKSAQEVLANLLSDLPKSTKAGLMVYGHRYKDSCDDIEILSPIGADSPKAMVGKIRTLQPKGRTPVAGALFGSTLAFKKLKGQNNHVVLISDGVETCGGDPCMAASVLHNANIKPKVHVVGFDLGAAERKKLECIPRMGGGNYFSAANAGELKQAVARVRQVAEAAKKPAPAPKPRKKGLKEVFKDDFNGEDLAEDWEVLNPDPESFLVEDGGLLILSGQPGSIANETVGNFLKLSKPLPKGDWVITAKFSVDYQTGLERNVLVLHHDADNYIEVGLYAGLYGTYSGSKIPAIFLKSIKRTKGKQKEFSKRFFDGQNQGPFPDRIKPMPQPILVRLVKKGRSYRAGAMLAGAKEPRWVDLEKFTSLRQKGTVAVGFYQGNNTSGESTATFDWVKIEAPE